MSKPVRIQRKRTKDWKMPENTIYVGRPTKWGNPYRIGRNLMGGYVIVCPNGVQIAYGSKNAAFNQMFYMYEKEIENIDLSELKGKNLACWCPVGKPCHADILLKLANK